MKGNVWFGMVPVWFALLGCATVGLDSEFVETTNGYREDGSVEASTETRWTQNARGGAFTNIEAMKQDTSYVYDGPEGEHYTIGQGSGAEGVSGAGQIVALTAALQALAQVLSIYNPLEPLR